MDLNALNRVVLGQEMSDIVKMIQELSRDESHLDSQLNASRHDLAV